MNFLASIGVDFIGPLLQPPFPTKRFYQALPGGRVYVHRLARRCRSLGVAFRTTTRATRLVTRDGAVTGVAVESDGGPAETCRLAPSSSRAEIFRPTARCGAR